MADAEQRSMFTNGSSIRVGDIESGSIPERVRDINRKVSPISTTSTITEVVANSDGDVEEIDKWVCSLEKILENVPQYMCTRGHPGRISRIPENLREVDIKGYEPYILSIGPYHNGKPKAEKMEKRKRLVLKCVLRNKPELRLKDYLAEILSIEPTARSFYSDVLMDREQFVRMLLLDSVFLLTMFCGMPKSRIRMTTKGARTETRVENKDSYADLGEKQENQEDETVGDTLNSKIVARADDFNDEIILAQSGEHWYWTLFAHDIFLLENQIPFFVLQKIHNLAFDDTETQLIDVVKSALVHMLEEYVKLDSTSVVPRTEEAHHLLHLCHMFFRPTIQQEFNSRLLPESNQMFRLGSATQLYESGVHFQARYRSTEYSLLDISFDSSGKMAMSCLHVDDNTESLLRNLIALEQMKYPSLGLNISAYVVLLLHLVTTPKDVELLRKKKIIQHHLSSDKEMMYLVNRLSQGLAFDYVEDQYCLKHVFQELKNYSERRVPRWRAWLRHRHFINPWTIISLWVASLFLLLTVVQTYYAVYSYYYPPYHGQL